MKLLTDKGIIKKIIIAILIVMSFNFISPTISRADFGGALFQPIAQLLRGVADLVIQGLQYFFIGVWDISIEDRLTVGDPEYYILYSPGMIFSNRVGLDVNFIDPAEDIKITTKKADIITLGEHETIDQAIENSSKTILTELGYAEDTASDSDTSSLDTLITYQNLLNAANDVNEEAINFTMNGKNYCIDVIIMHGTDSQINYFVMLYEMLNEDEKNPLYELCNSTILNDDTAATVRTKIIENFAVIKDHSEYSSKKSEFSDTVKKTLEEFKKQDKKYGSFTFEGKELLLDYTLNPDYYYISYARGQFDEEVTVEQTSKILQPTVATWYKTLRAIALVGLLSVLVYVGIRILISSTGQEKAKYKKMIMDWLVAMCILFILQYIMVFTLEITQKITDILSVNVVGENGEDMLMSDLRNQVGNAEDFQDIFFTLIMYLVLVIHTVMFTIQYLKRLIYMAFFTLIAPLIALTYPIDKIKDGQAQAFTTWIREYIFNALLQPMHLLLYVIFVTSAMELVKTNWLYAVVAIGFLLPAEKFFRKMFGFDKASSASPLKAAAGGALIMNAINKMGQKSGKHAAGGSSGGAGSGGSAGVRTSSSNAGNIGTGRDSSGSGGTAGSLGTERNASQFGPTMKRAISAPKGSGMAAIGRRVFSAKSGRKIRNMARRGALGAAGAAALGTVGLAAGIATGDASNAFSYGLAGLGAGYAGANALGDSVLAGEKSLRETFKEGAIGQNEYNNLKADKAFYESDEFMGMVNNPELLSGTTGLGRTAAMRNAVQTYRDNGITDTGKIATAMKAGLSPAEGAYAIKLAQMIGQSGWNNPSTRKDFEARYKSKIPGTNGDKIWKSIESLL